MSTLMVSIDFTPEQLRAISTACAAKFTGLALSEKFSPLPLDAKEREIKDGLESALDVLGEGLRAVKLAEEAGVA